MARQEKGGIARSAGVVAALTLLSRVLGLLRDAVLARQFDKRVTDAFFVAFTVPNIFRRLLAEGGLSSVFVKVFTDYRKNRGEDAARDLAARTLSMALIGLLGVTALGILFAPQLLYLFAGGFARNPQKMVLARDLTRLVFPFLVTVGLAAMAMAVLNSYRHFAAPAFAPVILNVGIIAVVLLFAAKLPRWGMPSAWAIGFGVLIGGLLQLLVQLPLVARYKMLVRPRSPWGDEGVLRILRLLAPSLFALAIYQLNVMLARLLASFLPGDGPVSFLYYAQRLIEFPIGVGATAIATVAMPTWSAQVSTGDIDALKKSFGHVLRLVFFLMLPATAGLMALALPLTSVLFVRGRFSYAMARPTAWTLIGFCSGLWAAGGVRQVQQVFISLEDTRTPVKVSALALVTFAAAGLLLYRPLGTLGLALAVSLASSVNFVALIVLLRRRLGALGLRSVAISLLRSLVSAAACGLVAWLIARGGAWQAGASPANLLRLVWAVVAGGLAFVGCAWVLRSSELRTIRRR